MTRVISRRQQPDGSALHAVETDDGGRWVVRTVPWYSDAGVMIGVQWFLLERDVMSATVEDAETAALELANSVRHVADSKRGPVGGTRQPSSPL